MTSTNLAFTPTSSLQHRTALTLLAHFGPAILTVFFMWLPFGFALTGLLEEWGVIGLFSRIGVFFVTDVTSAMPAHALRPLTIFPHALGYFLDPDTFNYWHVLLIIALVIKGWALSVITTRITGALKWGMLASILVIVFPADTMQLSFRSIHINWALSLVLLASVTFLHALDQRSRARAFTFSILSSLLLAAGCAMYEVALLLAAIPALVVFVQVGFSGLIPHLKRFFAHYLIWAAGAVAYIAYVIHTAPLVQTYQGAVVGDSALASLKSHYSKIFTLGLGHSIIGGWIDAVRITLREISSYWYLALATLVLLVLIQVVARKSTALTPANENGRSWSMLGRMIVVGLLLICMGYLPFIFNLAHMSVSQRTFLYAAPGATLFFLALFVAVDRYSKIASTAVAALLVCTGLAAQLFQFQHYIDISQRQQRVLKDIVENFDGNAVNKTLVILDYSNELNHDWMFLNPNLSAVLFHIYGKPVDTLEVCYMPSHEWQQTDSLARKGTCEQTAEGWTFHYPTPAGGPGVATTQQLPDRKLAKADVVTVAVGKPDPTPTTPELEVYRRNLASNVLPISARLHGITESAPWFNFFTFRNQEHRDEYFWGFGKYWSLDAPIAGSGWRNTEWEASRVGHTSSAWKNAPHATLNFDLAPTPGPYAISGLFNAFANEKIRAEMQVLVNGTVIPVQWSADGSFGGDLNPQLLKTGRNVIEFVSAVDNNYYGLSARLDWVKIAKQR
ncbi:hypothetical protein EVS84_00700 [Pseudomonas koreensis]|uniref:Glycosyltransferase RgtA/B/C/D-like domain-containing protein n=2 Tax=Pseudomonas TaxID=286 RepID=A0A4Q4LA79_9PSED|nr:MULTISPECIES: hypothetical protein [Pseudomonas]MDM8190705.1 hypothetical protein [Pseudomonas fluorescens]MDP8571950.1 hypothetical protein [Pseudomonas iranensis]RYM44295.1 hypothetical protein EVS84_00700 [Pseudomonas koreensis]